MTLPTIPPASSPSSSEPVIEKFLLSFASTYTSSSVRELKAYPTKPPDFPLTELIFILFVSELLSDIR